MSVSSSLRTEIYKEVFDEFSEPSEEEIRHYAVRIGIDPVTEPHLLPIARDGLMHPLPDGWSPCKQDKLFFYHNSKSGESRWDHPLDDFFRNTVLKAKTESISSTGEEDSKTSAKDDLRSYEEATVPSEMLPRPSETLGTARKNNLQLAPLRKSPAPFSSVPDLKDLPRADSIKKLSLPFKRDSESSFMKRSVSNTEFGGKSPSYVGPDGMGSNESLPARSPSRIDLDAAVMAKKKDSLSPLQEKHPRSLYGHGELTLKGGGSMFLKSRQKRSEDPSPGDADSEPRGILREAPPLASPKQLWDVDPREMTTEEKRLWRKQELQEDDRKSVRFNLDKEPKIEFDAEEDAEEEWNSESQGTDEERVIAGVKVADILGRMDKEETQVGTLGDLSGRSITDKLKGLYLNDEVKEVVGGKLSDEKVTFLKNLKLKTPQEIKEMNVVNGREHRDTAKISEKRQLGSSLFRNDIISKSVEKIVLNGDLGLDKSSLEYDLSNQGKITMYSGSEAEEDSATKMKSLRERMKEEEGIERDRLKLQTEERMIDFRAALRERREAQEKEAEADTVVLMDQARAALREKHEREATALRRDYEGRYEEERKRLEAECKDKIAALKKDMSEMLGRMEEQQAAERERMLKEMREKSLLEMEEMREKSCLELDQMREKLSEEMSQRRASLIEKHTQDLQEALPSAEQSQRLLDLTQKAEEHDKQMEALRTQRAAELDRLEKEHEGRLAELKLRHAEETEDLKTKHDGLLSELKLRHEQQVEDSKGEHQKEIEKLEAELEDRLAAARDQHEGNEEATKREQEKATEKLRSGHAIRLEVLRNEWLKEEEVIRREHLERLTELKGKLEAERQRLKTHSDDKDASGLVFEKLRCEKRLLEDKYRTLKDKYVRLKGDVKMSVERRRKREVGNTTGSETERSTSHKANDRSAVSDSLGQPPKNDNEKAVRRRTPPAAADNNNGNKGAQTPPKNLQSRLPSEEVSPSGLDDQDTTSSSPAKARPVEHHRKRRQLFARLKSASTSHLNNNPEGGGDTEVNCSPVENLRRQLQKLDDLEEQFPAATHTDTYLRYPFSDPGQCASSELEFFRHRIHLERDSVRRAKDFLQIQRDSFRARQRQLKQRPADSGPTARSVLHRMADEEKELTDMEVSLHRTRGLLGEKIIRLRHLEQSLHRASTPKVAYGEDATLSDVSSHSGGSSGFSSIEMVPLETVGISTKRQSHPYRESTEIIRSLENLNTEIHDIWEVLNKARPTAIPPPPFAYPDWLNPPPSRPYPAVGQYSPVDPVLVERTRSLRDWLRQARIDSAEMTSPGQATL